MISNRTRFLVLRRFGFMCVYCGRGYPAVTLEIDHVNPRAAGGTDDLPNLVAACYDCNRGKGALPAVLPPLPTAEQCVAVHRTGVRKARRQSAGGFMTWLKKQYWRDDPVGDLCRDVIRQPPTKRRKTRRELNDFFLQVGGDVVAHAFYTAWREFKGSALTATKMRTLRYEIVFEGFPYPYRKEGYVMKVDQFRGRTKWNEPYRVLENGMVGQ